MSYFDNQIRMYTILGHGLPYGLPTNANAKQWIERIENDLSPENLTCDGELPRNQVLAKRRELEGALQYCQNLLGGYVPFAQRLGRHSVAYANRTIRRENSLQTAVQAGFRLGARILISNGTTGTIIKINRTRVKVKGDDGRMWSVPPRCMTLVKGR